MLKASYDRMMLVASHRHATLALFAVAFAESSFLPIPPDVMLMPMVLAERAKAWWYASVATVASVFGGVAGYAIGFYLFVYFGQPILKLYGMADGFGQFSQWFRDYGVWILVIKGMTPIPYKLLTITAGAAHMNLLAFVAASIVARAMRFFLVAGLLYWFGPPIREFVERRLILVTTMAVVLLLGGFAAIKVLG